MTVVERLVEVEKVGSADFHSAPALLVFFLFLNTKPVLQVDVSATLQLECLILGTTRAINDVSVVTHVQCISLRRRRQITTILGKGTPQIAPRTMVHDDQRARTLVLSFCFKSNLISFPHLAANGLDAKDMAVLVGQLGE